MIPPGMINQMRALSRRAELASVSGHPLEIKLSPEESAALAELIDEALAQDQTWFWSEAWQVSERASEADLVEDRYRNFDNMEDMLRDLGHNS